MFSQCRPLYVHPKALWGLVKQKRACESKRAFSLVDQELLRSSMHAINLRCAFHQTAQVPFACTCSVPLLLLLQHALLHDHPACCSCTCGGTSHRHMLSPTTRVWSAMPGTHHSVRLHWLSEQLRSCHALMQATPTHAAACALALVADSLALRQTGCMGSCLRMGK